MSSSPPLLPGLKTLYWNDLTFRRGANLLGFGLVVAVGMWWVTRPIEGVPPTVDRSFEEMVKPWGMAGGIALAGGGGLLLLGRRRRVRRVLSSGTRLSALVEDLEAVRWSSGRDETAGQSHYRHSYYVTLRYLAQGSERLVRQKLPGAGFTFGLIKGRETEVVVLDSAPEKPLIRALYSK